MNRSHLAQTFCASLTLIAALAASSAQAQSDIYQGRTLYFTSNQTWVVPDNLVGISSIHVRAVGGGGGGHGDCGGCGAAGAGGASAVSVLGETMTAFGGGAAGPGYPGPGGGSNNCDFGVNGSTGDANPRSANSAGGSPFMYGHATAGGGAGGGYGWGGPGIIGSGGGHNVYGGGGGGFCQKSFVVSAGTPVFITVGGGGGGGPWGGAGKSGLVVIQY